MKETIEIELSDVDVRYGIIKIGKYKNFFKGEHYIIALKCNGKEYKKRITAKGYNISGLTDIHRENGAHKGTIVSITKENKIFSLQYTQETDKKTDQNSLENTIEEIRYLMKEHTWAFFKNETNLRNEIIDPILEQLGWRFPDFLFREPITRDSKKVDYALRYNGHFQILIESKSVDHFESKDWEKAVKQLQEYLEDDRFIDCIGILTNGVTWEVFYKKKSVASLNIFNKAFINFANCFKMDEFKGIDNLVEKLKKLEFLEENPSAIINAHEIILTDKEGKEIGGKYEVNKYLDFIKENVEQINDFDKNGYFGKEVVKERKDDINKARGVQQYQNKFIAKDYSTLEKATIIQQIIRELEKQDNNAYSIKIIND